MNHILDNETRRVMLCLLGNQLLVERPAQEDNTSFLKNSPRMVAEDRQGTPAVTIKDLHFCIN